MRHRRKKIGIEYLDGVAIYHFMCSQCEATFSTQNKGPIRVTDYQLKHTPSRGPRGMAIREWTDISTDCAEQMAKHIHSI